MQCIFATVPCELPQEVIKAFDKLNFLVWQNLALPNKVDLYNKLHKFLLKEN